MRGLRGGRVARRCVGLSDVYRSRHGAAAPPYTTRLKAHECALRALHAWRNGRRTIYTPFAVLSNRVALDSEVGILLW